MTDQTSQMARFGINGLVATAVHYSALSFNLHILNYSSAGLANFTAALFGIYVSFIGSRYFVFPGSNTPILGQALKFGGLYAMTAMVHGSVLLVWTDWYHLDYRLGFIAATALQVLLSFFGNKHLVFKT